MRRDRATITLQISILVAASLLEVAANFAASDTQSPVVRLLIRFALPALVVLLLLVAVGNIVAFRLEHPSADRPARSGGRNPVPHENMIRLWLGRLSDGSSAGWLCRC